MDVDISVPAGLQFVAVHEKFPVQFFIQFVKNQTALRRHQGTVCVRIAFIPDVTDGLAFGIHVIHHMDKIFFVIAVIPVALCHRRIHLVQRALHDIVHILDVDPFFAQRFRLFLRKLTDKADLVLCKRIQDTGRRLVDRIDDFLHIKRLFCAIFLNYMHY